ncbi:MmoB/DmpM family protein [Gordonia sp. PDNC005]|jgi:toluene monooxygenase system protein D|uniref:MmoB/DmpM family protein n=1 Tax=unclassified Gordonia (in: high G+C Gram-positive bacteria) TaxID=2657482 RepID=UPI0019640615|nr:MmoB/DmpM family protein [Gordonia sp. PDNC005]MDR2279431.1 MmoB/DmpM family protein [Gordonia sp. (in: high G+C Gram-positive bacteria)]QRY61167.1 MmoB/DmpM family protein [Gordonia sp. PDNC005]
MTDTTGTITDPVGPVVQAGEIADAVASAAVIDNDGQRVDIRNRGSYVRVEVDGGECILRRQTIEEELGRPFLMRELEVSMPSFVGRIETGTEQIRFYLAHRA